jgi:serpin B
MALVAFAAAHLHGADIDPATTAINSLGIRLLATTGKPKENALLSPYSIQEALAMTYAGADGKTRDEMAKALHYPKDDVALNAAFASLRQELDEIPHPG